MTDTKTTEKLTGGMGAGSKPEIGQKSAEEVAKLVQSKVNIYVNEQR